MTTQADTRERVARRPTELQRQRVKEILRSCPGLIAGGPLTLIYTPARTAETSWLCAQARAGGLSVRLCAVTANAQAVQRKLHTETAKGATIIVLADLALSLPADALQLSGTQTHSPIDLWRPLPELTERAEALIGRLASPLTVGEVTLETGPWFVQPTTVEAAVDQADGTFVANAAVAVNRPVQWDTRLATHPVTLTVHKGLVMTVRCADPMLHRFLNRAVHTHLVNRVAAVRIGLHPVSCGFTAVAGPVNIGHPGLALRLSTDGGRAFSAASADLCLDLTSTHDPASILEGESR